jgi:tetratricopeptide (TPR) repeat protein
MKRQILLVVCIVLSYCAAFAQAPRLEDSLRTLLSKAKSLEERMHWTAELAVHYIESDRQKSEEYALGVIEMADSSRNRELIAKSWIYNAHRCYALAAFKEYLARGIEYSHKALEIARSNNLPEYQAWAYVQLARGQRLNGEIEKAVNSNIQAIALATDIDNDSLKVYVYTSLGNTYLQKDEKLLAFRNYLQALNVAEESGNYNLLLGVYGRLAGFYLSMEDYEKAKDYEFKKLAALREKNRRFEMLEAYTSIGNLYVNAKQYDQAKKYFETVIALADSLQFPAFKLGSYLRIVNMYLTAQENQKALDYFNAHPQVAEYMLKHGMDYVLDNAYGAIYTLTGNLDSAGPRMARAEKGFEAKTSLGGRFYFYTNYAWYYKLRKDYDKSIAYWMKAKEAGDHLGSLEFQQYVFINLDSVYMLKGDYKNAHFYNSQAAKLKDSLQKLSKEKDLLSLEIENENRRKEREAVRLEQEKNRRHNIQYMAIVIAIASIFLVLVMAGVFSVSKTTIHVLGFFAFIFLFEFIILLADNQIHHWTHGEPWKVLAIKIVLIAMLLPLHHYLEKKLISYLTTQNLLKEKGRSFVRKWFKKKGAGVPLSNT